MKTKRLLAAAAMLLGLVAVPFTRATAQAGGKQPTYVLVHGAWGGSWSFKKVDSMLTARGYNVYRPSLTGQGERVHLASQDINLTTHINDVVNAILYEDLHDVILMGHSYGGMVVTGVADRIPDRIKRLVYLDAFVPNDGESAFTAQGSPAQSEGIRRMEKDGFLVPAWVKADQKPPKDVPHPVKTLTEPISLKNAAARQLPATYILTVDPGKKPEEDGFFKFSERAKQRGWNYVEMSADHNPQWSKPQELVELLDKAK
ncbi:alpha/beta fold hydrolase [Telluribacter humicola]|uniref:alpha/beta fold hydrolase n=1 Tax=Telluribacter humicola TaxID=1720261 RepID=UPI001A965A2A|nr:alpha/beta hydrolase [Telluribacter humicola]